MFDVKMNNAWLITWIVAPTSKKNVDRIAAILSSRKSEKTVIEFAKLLYLRTMFSAFDMAYYANRPNEIPFPVHENGMIGNSPYWLYARRVTNLEIQRDEENNKESISWVELPEINEGVNSEGKSEYWERQYYSPLSKDLVKSWKVEIES